MGYEIEVEVTVSPDWMDAIKIGVDIFLIINAFYAQLKLRAAMERATDAPSFIFDDDDATFEASTWESADGSHHIIEEIHEGRSDPSPPNKKLGK